MEKDVITQRLLQDKIIAVVRMKDPHNVMPMIEALVAGGIGCLEVTSNTPDYLESIQAARSRFGDTLIGIGTVINAKIAESAIAAGAQYLFSPNTNRDVVQVAHAAGIPVAMGAMTPTEVCNAVEWGADIIKLFPADALGLEYLRDLLAPLSGVNIFAVGGVTEDNVQTWADAGAVGFGIGGCLTSEQSIASGNAHEIVAAAKRFNAAVSSKRKN